MASQSVEEYVEAIFRLGAGESAVSTSELAQSLKVAAPSVTTMLRRLVRDGLAQHKPYHGVLLTETGKGLAQSVIRSHRLSERLLTDMLGVPWDQAHEHACKLEHVIVADLADRVYAALGRPQTCPHGNPIDGDEELGLVGLHDLGAGEEAAVAKITDEGADLLRHLASMGLKPGAVVKLHAVSPLGDAFAVEVDGRVSPVGMAAAKVIWVKRAER